MKVEWHENIPEDQPDENRFLWLFENNLTLLHRPPNAPIKAKKYAVHYTWTHWAYAEIPEPPEKPE